MANGTAALQIVAPEPPSTAAPVPDMAAEIGELTADLVVQIGQGLLDHESTGVMALTTKWQAGDLFAKLYEIQQATIGTTLDFEAAMVTQGKIALARRFRAGVRQQLCADLDTAVLDAVHGQAIGWVADILMRVARGERARAN